MSMRDEEPADRARAQAEELAWRDIVDHYGDRPDVIELSDLTTPLDPPEPEPEAGDGDGDTDGDDPFRFELEDETFTPPPLPPPPVISPERRVAWVGLVAAPILLVLLNLWDYSLPGILSVGLVIVFVASFGYLVATMTPRDPDDDGARV
ncbi:MAG TPA: hypothetical protein VH228_12605 [Nocardioides sp.]|nr:hypothetical protein [Nocardioides sp.]